MAEIPAKYDPKVQEQHIRKLWEKNQTYKFNPNSQKPIYAIDTPPPTMSGKMHVGHAFSFAQQDIIARFKRMRGFEVFYPFGTDDNGLPTEKLIQKEKKVSASKMERDAFIKLCLDYLAEERPHFIADWKNIGMSCDFSINYSTIDPHCRTIAQKTFLDLYKKGLAYRKEAPVIWDTVFQTAIAQAELEDVEKKSYFNDIIFKHESGKDLIIATTRPELLSACVAVFAHPDDKRYQPLLGTTAYSPLYNVKVPIMADEKVQPDKGTGIVMCCTFGDQTDIEWYKKYNLPLKMAITRDGKMSELSGKYVGLKIEEARAQIIQDLKDANLLINQKEIMHTVNVGERSGMPVEIMNSQQWYISYLDKKEEFLERSNQITWRPAHMKHRLDNWIKGLNWDWSISRQRKYGIPIPVWYDENGKVYLADESQLPVDPIKDRPLSAPKDIKLTPETDVFDTWFTSASSPIIVKELFKGQRVYAEIFPMQLRPQAHDIINFWLFYTMVKSHLLYNELPWKEAVISGYVLDPKGEKMSKSKGNVISPQAVMQKHSADALRYWAATSKLGEDTPYQEKELTTANKLITKLWNAAKFVSMITQDSDGQKPQTLHTNDQWVLLETKKTIDIATESFEEFEFSKARHETDSLFWNVFCDSYLESIKKIHYAPEMFPSGAKQSMQWTVTQVLTDILKLYALFIPYITDAVYTTFINKGDESSSIHTQAWPDADYGANPESLDIGKQLHELLSATRRYKAEKNVALNTEISQMLLTNEQLKEFEAIIKGTTNATTIEFVEIIDQPSFEVGQTKVFMTLNVVKKE